LWPTIGKNQTHFDRFDPLTVPEIRGRLLKVKRAGAEGMRSKPSIEENVVYSREEAAQVLGVSLSTLKRLINTGQLAASQPAGMRRVFIKGSSILAMLDTTRVENGHYVS